MRAEGVMLNDCSDMDMRSESSSFKTEASTSPSVGKRSYNLSTEKDDEKPLGCPMSVESSGDGNRDGDGRGDNVDAPSDEEGGPDPEDTAQQQQKWSLKDGMVQVKVSRGRSSSITTEESGNSASDSTAEKLPTFENARLKWDKATAQLTKRRVDLLGAQSWHGRRRHQDFTPVKTRSAPRNSIRSLETTASSSIQGRTSTEMTESNHSQPVESGKNKGNSPSPPHQTNGNSQNPNGNVSTETDADEQSISLPTAATARSKFAAMSESANLESSTTSFLGELPKMPRRWKIDDDGSVASSVVRGGRIYKIQGPSTTKRFSYSSGPSKWTPRQSLPSSNSNASRTLTRGTSSESSDDDDVTEYDTVVQSNNQERRGSVERTESGSSFTPSIATYDDFDTHYPLETVPSAGSKTDPQDPESGQEESVYAPLNDTESYRKANQQEEDDEKDEEEEEELGDYEEDLQDAEARDDYHFVVDKVPKKKRWTSKNIHNFPVWPPIIKVQTWDKKNVSAVSIGSGFSFDESFTNSNAVVSSLGDDDISYEEEEFVRRPPEHRTSYRIRYDGPTSLRLEDIYKTPIVDSDGRFASTKKPADGLPTMPARRVTDLAPSAPPRISTSDTDDVSVSLSAAIEDEGNKRPDVWITPVSGSLPTEPVWKVRRVWAVEDEDEKEEDHAVGNHELFEKIKSLVGARDGPAGNVLDNAPQLPQRSWHVRTIVEKRGRLENVEAEKSLDVTELQENMKVMAEEAVKEIVSNQQVFEEYKKKRELQKAEEELMQDMVTVESFEEVDNPTFFNCKCAVEANVPVDDVDEADHVAEAGNINVDDIGKVGSVEPARISEVGSVKVVEAAEAPIDDAFDVDEVAIADANEANAKGNNSTNDKEEPVTDVHVENDDETVVEMESGIPPTANDVSEKKTTKKKKKREISPKSSPKPSKEAIDDESTDVPRTPVSTKQKRRSSTGVTATMVIHSPSPAATPRKSLKSKSKSIEGVSPKRVSKSKELVAVINGSPVQNSSSTDNNLDTSKFMTPKAHKSNAKLVSPKPKSPKREKKKTDTLRKGRKSATEKEETETETSSVKNNVISLSQLVRNGTDSSDDDDDDSAVESVEIQSARREGRFPSNSKLAPAALTSPEPQKPTRISLAAMVHDSDSENDESGSDDEHSRTASIGPRIVQQATNKSPRRGPGWWNTPGGTTKRRSYPLKGTRPFSPPLEKSDGTKGD